MRMKVKTFSRYILPTIITGATSVLGNAVAYSKLLELRKTVGPATPGQLKELYEISRAAGDHNGDLGVIDTTDTKAISKLPVSDEVKEFLKEVDGPCYMLPGIIPIPWKSGAILYQAGSTSVIELAHEFGHCHYVTNKNSGFLGRVAHKLDTTCSAIARVIGLGQVLYGVQSIDKRTDNSDEGLSLKKVLPFLPALGHVPTLMAEGKASAEGLKILEKSKTVDPETKGLAKKVLGTAWMTYFTGSLGVQLFLSCLSQVRVH